MSDRIELAVPGSTTADLVGWATRMQALNPVTAGFPPFRPPVAWILTDQPFMGVELTCMAGKEVVYVMAFFADVPTEEEREIMNRDDTRWAQR